LADDETCFSEAKEDHFIENDKEPADDQEQRLEEAAEENGDCRDLGEAAITVSSQAEPRLLDSALLIEEEEEREEAIEAIQVHFKTIQV
jgi:hypothetical protein